MYIKAVIEQLDSLLDKKLEQVATTEDMKLIMAGLRDENGVLKIKIE